ncbi:hypothetical protein RJ640_023153 [Escallonia rubra]|uniref:DUF7866 domain-containing protein n=1 Tax=Escallonia rubra TaxID=112253 RepID=A0AA88RE86_9ASTE|nr:hypothetical protein RJ640_023153 [Escallonia rubra]
MSDVVETLEPLQSSGGGAKEVSSSIPPLMGSGGPFALGGFPDYRMHHRFVGTVGAVAGCRSPNPNCSPGGPAACRTPFNGPPSSMVVGAVSSSGELKPAGTTEYRMPFDDHLAVLFADGNAENRRRRKLAQPFQLCLVCRCCVAAADPTSCANMPCCFGIDCQLPNKPFGVCVFVPKTCNCTSCAV